MTLAERYDALIGQLETDVRLGAAFAANDVVYRRVLIGPEPGDRYAIIKFGGGEAVSETLGAARKGQLRHTWTFTVAVVLTEDALGTAPELDEELKNIALGVMEAIHDHSADVDGDRLYGGAAENWMVTNYAWNSLGDEADRKYEVVLEVAFQLYHRRSDGTLR